MKCKIAANLARVLIVCGFILPCACTTPNQSYLNIPIPDEIPLAVKVGDEPIFVKLRLETGEELPFMLDTGVATTILDKSLEMKLGKRLGSHEMAYGWKAFGKPTCGIYAAPNFYLGNVRLQTGSRVDTDDLTKIWPGYPMMGILGMDCLRNYCIQLDFAAKKMRFLNPDHLSPENLGRTFPLTFSGNVFTRMDFFDKKNVWFMLDTGAWGNDGALTADLFNLALQKQNEVWTYQSKDTNGIPFRMTCLPECSIMSETYTNLFLKTAPWEPFAAKISSA
jgi:hypothetical protein